MFDFINTNLFLALVGYSVITTSGLWLLWVFKRGLCYKLIERKWFGAWINGLSLAVYGISLGYDWKTTLAASAASVVFFVSLGLYQGYKVRRMLAS